MESFIKFWNTKKEDRIYLTAEQWKEKDVFEIALKSFLGEEYDL